MGMLVNDVTALVASLAKVCQPSAGAAGAWASWAAPGQPRGTAAEHTLLLISSHTGAFISVMKGGFSW